MILTNNKNSMNIKKIAYGAYNVFAISLLIFLFVSQRAWKIK